MGKHYWYSYWGKDNTLVAKSDFTGGVYGVWKIWTPDKGDWEIEFSAIEWADAWLRKKTGFVRRTDESRFLVVTEHLRFVDYVIQKGLADKECRVRFSISLEDVRGMDVIVLTTRENPIPLDLAVAAHSVTVVDLDLSAAHEWRRDDELLSTPVIEKVVGDPVRYEIGKLAVYGPERSAWYTCPMKKNAIVVTQHPALVDLLVERAIIPPGTPVIEHATVADVADRNVIGILPLSLAAAAETITTVTLKLTADDRGKELPIERLRVIAGEAVTYSVEVVDG